MALTYVLRGDHVLCRLLSEVEAEAIADLSDLSPATFSSVQPSQDSTSSWFPYCPNDTYALSIIESFQTPPLSVLSPSITPASSITEPPLTNVDIPANPPLYHMVALNPPVNTGLAVADNAHFENDIKNVRTIELNPSSDVASYAIDVSPLSAEQVNSLCAVLRQTANHANSQRIPQDDVAIDIVSHADTSKGCDGVIPNGLPRLSFIPYRELIANLPFAISHHLSHAMQRLRWQQTSRYCTRCGTPLVDHPRGGVAKACPACHLSSYPTIQPCVITAITRLCPETQKWQVLLAHHHRYGVLTDNPQYGLIAGFVEVGETLEDAVRRETLEEVGLTVSDIQYVASQPWPYPSNLMLGFHAMYAGGDIVVEEAELTHAKFFYFDNLPKIPPAGTIAHTLIQHVGYKLHALSATTTVPVWN